MEATQTQALHVGPHSLERYLETRRLTEDLCQPLAVEDYAVQARAEASPPKWHLAHTSWFFETFVLKPNAPDYRSIDERYECLFNSYYVHVSEPLPQAHRGTFSRPTVKDVVAYRQSVDAAMCALLEAGVADSVADVIEIGLQHEQQHQELLMMDVKALLNQPPFFPPYRPSRGQIRHPSSELSWTKFDGGLTEIGHQGEAFSWDNECPRHRVYLEPFDIADRTVTNREWLDFIEDGAYDDPRLWLSDGWDHVQKHNMRAPLYWYRDDDAPWQRFTLEGLQSVHEDDPVCHVSYYEADAFARWYGCRLPTEFEWEAFIERHPRVADGAFLDDNILDPRPVSGSGPRGFSGGVWEWTSSAYGSYPGYEQPGAAFGEYNGKFMVNQKVLRGGCAVTPRSHYRLTYRNFFYPHQRWVFSGIRLAR